jgi:hypothetical protein
MMSRDSEDGYRESPDKSDQGSEVSRRKFLESRFMRNTFDPDMFDSSHVSTTINRARSFEVNDKSGRPVSIPIGDDMGHLSRRIYMGRDVSLNEFEDQQAESFGSRLVLNSVRKADTEERSNRIIDGSGSAPKCQTNGPTIVSPLMVSRFIGELIREHMVDGHRLQWSVHPRPQFTRHDFPSVPAMMTPGSYDFLNRPGYKYPHSPSTSASRQAEVPRPPELDEIVQFFHKICADSLMEYECAIISLIYIERVIRMSDGMLTINAINWKGLVLASMLLSSKVCPCLFPFPNTLHEICLHHITRVVIVLIVHLWLQVWDDFHIRNADYTEIFFGLGLERINSLELGLLKVMRNDLWVSPSQYAEVHFKIQEMFTKDELNKATAERHIVKKQRSNIRRKKPVPMTRTPKNAGHTSPSFVPHQVHCFNSATGNSSKHGDPSVITSSKTFPIKKSLGSHIRCGFRASIRRFINWAFLYHCGRITDVATSPSVAPPK